MIVNLVVTNPDVDVYEVTEAWDEYAVAENEQGWKDKLAEIVKKWGQIRVVEIEVPDDFMQKAFEPVRIKAKTL